ncbi:MAG: hypothetical protein AAB424_04375 [Patescibacteria group bacterium]
MKKLSLWFLAVFIMFAVVGFSASPSWAYPNPFQAIAAQEQPQSTSTITTATDQSPPFQGPIDWNTTTFTPSISATASPAASDFSDLFTLVIGDCYPNPFNQFFGVGVANNTNTLPAQHAQEVPYVYIGDQDGMWTIDERYPNPFYQNRPNLMDMGFSA